MNLSTVKPEEGCHVERDTHDIDMFTAGSPIHTEEELIEAIAR
ncbi:hypothetical protein [Parendozoicomonas haliclonae]|nr:hypothetical protein [Parendozoicomonas haliclonae]